MPPCSKSPIRRRIHEYNYSPIDDPDFIELWEKIPVDLSTEPKGKLRKQEEIEDNNYFHAGLNLDNIRKQQTITKPEHAAPRACENIPKYNFVQMLQTVFDKPDLLTNNRFLNRCVAEKLRERKQVPKRVRFSLTEISLKHLPNCRRYSLDSQHGFLHAPKCKNYTSEKELPPKEFECRANFLRSNLKPERSLQEFFAQNIYDQDELPALPPLPASLDLKKSAVDSIEIHDKNSPGLRSKNNISENRELNRLSSSENSLQYHERQINPFKPSPPVLQVEKASPLEMSFRPVFSDAPIGGPKFLNLPAPAVKPSPASSYDSGFAEDSSDFSDIEAESAPKKVSIKAVGDDLLDDMMNDFSDSEDESIENEHEIIKNIDTHKNIFDEAIESADESVNSLLKSQISYNSSVSSPTVDFSVTIPTKTSFDLSFSDDSDSEIDFSEELKDLKSNFQSTDNSTTMWFKKPIINEFPKLTTPIKPVQQTNTETKSETNPIKTTYMNPFSKTPSDKTVRLTKPSILGTLVCSNKPTRLPDRLPAPVHYQDYFLFDTMSPDDMIRHRQSSVF